MGLLSDLLTRPFKRPVKDVPAPVPDRRGTERFVTTFPVSLSKPGMQPFAGSLINISTTGAAITVHGWTVPVPAPWPTHLKHGAEIALTGLLDVPLNAWFVAHDEGVLRLRFLLEDTVRGKLHELIAKLAAAR